MQKTVSISDDLWKYVTDNSISLSKYLQKKLREDIIKEGNAKQYNIQKTK